MTKRKKLIELGKSALIVLLIISALLLVRQSGYYSELTERFQPAQPSAPLDTESSAAASGSARPAVIVVSGSEGQRHAAALSSAELSSVFDNFSAALGEALGSAGTPESTGEARWRKCLTGSCVFFDFYYPQSLELLAVQLGTEAKWASGYFARMLALDCSGDSARLYFLGTDGVFYSCGTGVISSTLASRAESYRQTNAFWAFENDKYSGIEPYTAVLYDTPEIYSVSAAGLGTADFELDGLFRALGMNIHVMKQYVESDGTQVYVESGMTLRVRADGSISFKQSTSLRPGTLTEAAEAALAAVRGSLASACGDAELVVSAIKQLDGGGVTVWFDYSINGIPVDLGEGRHAARADVTGDEITRLELLPRRYTLGTSALEVLPMVQACAIAAAQGGGEVRLIYTDGGASVECGWVVS